MFSSLEKFSSASKAQLESQLAALNVQANKAVAAGEQVVSLNTSAAKAYLAESTVAIQQLLSAKDPKEFFALANSHAMQSKEKAVAYGHQLHGAISSIRAEITATVEAQIADTRTKVAALVDEVTKSAPAGSEKAVEILKSVIASANAGSDQLTKATKTAAEAVEVQFKEVAAQVIQGSKQAA
jgi:phasin family protein